MTEYKLTDDELKSLHEAATPVPYMVFGGVEPEDPYDASMRIWRQVAERVGCEFKTIAASPQGEQYFMATPLSKDS